MKALVWLVIAGCLVGIAFTLWAIGRRQAARRRESEARSAALLGEALLAARAKAKAPDTADRD